MTVYLKSDGKQQRMFDRDDLICVSCNAPLELGETAVVYNLYQHADIVLCADCTHKVFSALVQDYATMLDGTNLYENPPPKYLRTEAVVKATKSVGASLEEWLQYYQKFKSL
jgi:predicted RNA-binding Zn-ribbon protein involved in translation (DUF1610 family)